MLSQDLTLNPSDSIAAGTNASQIFSLLGGNVANKSVRSVASLATTAPRWLSIGHQSSVLKGFRTVANQAVPASDVVVDRRVIRLDYTLPQTTHLDPTFRIQDSVFVNFVNARMGSESSTVQARIDMLLALVAMLRASTNANAIRFFNSET